MKRTKTTIPKFDPALLLAEARAANAIEFMLKWQGHERRAGLFRRLLVAVHMADSVGSDPVEAIMSDKVLAAEIKKNPSVAEVIGADLNLALETVRMLFAAQELGHFPLPRVAGSASDPDPS